MTFNISPAVSVQEFDLTGTVPAVAATPAAFAGLFHWGPLDQTVLVDSESNQLDRFLKPSNYNAESWFTLASFFAYGGQAHVVRVGNTAGTHYHKTFVGNSTNFAISGANTILQLSNTTGLEVGQELFYTNNANLDPNKGGGITIASVNSTAVILSDSAGANVTSVDAIFRDPTLYSAIGQEVVTQNIEWAGQTVNNQIDYSTKDGTFDSETLYIARYPGSKGNSLRVGVCDSNTQYSSNTNLLPNAQINATASGLVSNVGSNSIIITVTPADTANAGNVTAANAVAGAAHASLTLGDLIQIGNSTMGFQFMKVSNTGTVSATSNVYSFTITAEETLKLVANSSQNTLVRFWEFYNVLGVRPGQSDYQLQFGNTSAYDELHVVVVDEGGEFSGVPGTVLEVFPSMSRATDSKNGNGTTNYYKNVINQRSTKIWWATDRSTATSGTAALLTSATGTAPLNLQFYGGSDGLDESEIQLGAIVRGYDLFSSTENIDISLIMTGKARGEAINANTQLATWLINNIAEKRKDCVVFSSPDPSFVVNNRGFEASDIVTARNTMPSSSYAFMDSGYKKMYDRYNDVFRWVPLNGDMAGLCAQVDFTNAQWWSPAGFNRGNIKNVVQLAWNPRESERDTLYTNGVNPVVRFQGLGTVLFGDKTMLAKPSAFNRINVRRLFIVLEKSIATAAKFTLFEFNDEFTRSQFKAMVNPFLRDIKSRRGITDFLVRCDATNNTAFVIQSNQFIADIFIRPNYSINWIKLNFISVPPTLSFDEAEKIQF
jgi:phage tail sheath protein FI